jgi:hypothetical protein
METPVTYFYTPIERDVSVKVEFPEGLLTEFYPPVRTVEPRPAEKFAFTSADPLTAAGSVPLKDGLLEWGTVHLIPPDSLRARVDDEELSRRIGKHVEQSLVPAADGNFLHYVAARETDSAIVQLRYEPEAVWERSLIPWDIAGTDRPIDYFEKFLFYRGVGNFDLPLNLSENTTGEFELVNSGQDEIRSLFLVTVDGKTVRFNRFDRIAGGDRLQLTQSLDTSSIGDLAESMVTSLTAEGLYEKEARAMVRCWQSSWFGEDGTRLLYMVPQSLTDELLPLEVAPQPDETVRVLVGRMEIMPAAQERHVLWLVQQSAAARQVSAGEQDRPFRSPSMDALLALGRLAEPALVRAKQIATDGQLRKEADQLLQDVRAASDVRN